ncbi:extracellular solute-binding protein [Cytobacillus spongiae]|uniref:extracellular solute-binding protein n=1 Tax=Cytobacillus spongiae TaxID=2901381 RepID=UPI001F1FB85B|nr:extracellular solute-binding protein [Cytobacillus spongiae]UII55509.1 extracellular solute-binding protein [Cytobacillus spongiae]
MEKVLKVLAVGDPAVYAYTDRQFSILPTFTTLYGTKVEFTIVPWNDYYGKLMDTFAGKAYYDIVMVAGHLWLKDFVEQGYLAEVNIPSDSEYDLEDIVDVIRDELKVSGKQYLYPSFCDGHFLLYRKSIVEKYYGELLPEVIDTATIMKVAAICHGKEGMDGIALKAHPSEIFLDFLPYLRNEGIDAFDPKRHVPTFNEPKGKEALTNYIKMKQFASANVEGFGNNEVREALQNKECVLAVTWGGQVGFVLDENCIDKDDIGFAALNSAWNVTWSFAIHQQSAHHELANEFLSYITSKQIDRMIGSYAGSPVRKSTYSTDSSKFAWYKTHLQLIEHYAKPLPMMEAAGDRMAPLYEEISNAFSGKKSVESALNDAESKVLEINSRSREQ